MFALGLLVLAWACGLHAVASAARSSVERIAAPDECARCFAENEWLTGRIEQLVVRVGQLEAELAAQRGDGQGGPFFHARKILILAAQCCRTLQLSERTVERRCYADGSTSPFGAGIAENARRLS